MLGFPASTLGRAENFFSLGGDSLAGLRVVRAVREAIAGEGTVFVDRENHLGHILGVFSPHEFLKRPVLAQYAAYLTARGEKVPNSGEQLNGELQPGGETLAVNGVAAKKGGTTARVAFGVDHGVVGATAEDVGTSEVTLPRLEGEGEYDDAQEEEEESVLAAAADGTADEHADRAAEVLVEAVRLGLPDVVCVESFLDCGIPSMP